MSDILVPTLGESISEATVGRWLKNAGDAVKKDDVLVELETDKVSVEVSATEDGVLSAIVANAGDTVAIGAVLGNIGAGGAAKPVPAAAAAVPVAIVPPVVAVAPAERPVAPSVRRVATEAGVDPASVPGTGRDGRATKADALAFVNQPKSAPPAATAEARPPRETGPREERVRMTRLRQTIARRLKEAQDTAAMLTTFNDVDMSAIMDLRKTHQDAFVAKHGIKLGFMSFFVKACVNALKEVPSVNAEIDGQDVIYKNYYDIGVAVGTDKGLVVPVVRGADEMSLAGIEKAIGALGKKARDGTLALGDLQGGTFTISNGGVYGSLMSTPILNPPQSGVLGMHRIEDRPIVRAGQIVIRPMMYLALSYDHRLVDGKEAVTFLVRVKEALEDPERMLLEV
jgi:2-oxoglutarate dehydrogenase E2 component (dihydrolipoamide succinyltransferase)